MPHRIININTLIHVFALLSLLNFSAFGQDRNWQTFAPTGAEWSVLSPGLMMPDAEAAKPKSKRGSYSYNDADGFFAVIYQDSKGGFAPFKPSTNSFFNKQRDLVIKANDGRLIKEEDFTSGEIKGREVQIRIGAAAFAGREMQTKPSFRVQRFRMFFVGKRFYVVLAVLPAEQINEPAVSNFLNSFAVR